MVFFYGLCEITIGNAFFILEAGGFLLALFFSDLEKKGFSNKTMKSGVASIEDDFSTVGDVIFSIREETFPIGEIVPIIGKMTGMEGFDAEIIEKTTPIRGSGAKRIAAVEEAEAFVAEAPA